MSKLWTLNMDVTMVITCIALLVTPAFTVVEGTQAKQMEIAGLGRTFTLGALYDARTDQISPFSLWKYKTILDGQEESNLPQTNLYFNSVSTLEDKFELMDIGANLQMSFLGGLVNVSGSARYLFHGKLHEKSVSLTMWLKIRNKMTQLPTEILDNIEWPQYLDKRNTHVVTRIIYGADAIIKFSKEVKDNESKGKEQDHLQSAVTHFANKQWDRNQANVDNETSKLFEDISVDFYGDFESITIPKTFDQVKVVVEEVRKTAISLPMMITLTPLHELSNNVTTTFIEIDQDIVQRVVEIKSNFQIIDEILTEHLLSRTVQYFPNLKKNLNDVQKMFAKEAGKFMSKLQKLLPEIRSDKRDIEILLELVNNEESGAFQRQFFDNWIKRRESFTRLLTKKLKYLSDDHSIRIISTEIDLVTYQSYNYNESYYLLQGTLAGIDEYYYIKALEQNNPSLADDPIEDTHSWKKVYKNGVFEYLKEFEMLDKLEKYDEPCKDNIGHPLRAVNVDLPSDQNKLEIKIFYGISEIRIKPIQDIRFEEASEYLSYRITPYADIETARSDPNNESYPLNIKILGYEIKYYENFDNITYTLDKLSKSSLTPGVTYKINVRVIIQGAVRGPWNMNDYIYTDSLGREKEL